MKRSTALLVVLFTVVGMPILTAQYAWSTPYTQAHVMGWADCAYYEKNGTANAEAAISMDNSMTTWVAHSAAKAGGAYGANDTYIGLAYDQLIDWPGPGEPSVWWDTSASYHLGWVGNGQNGALIDLEYSNPATGNILVDFEFVYGLPYELTSMTSISAQGSIGYASANATWADTVVFYGGATGSIGTADFEVCLES